MRARPAIANPTSSNEVLIVSSNLVQVGVINQAAGVAKAMRPEAVLQFAKVRIKRRRLFTVIVKALVDTERITMFRHRWLCARIFTVLVGSEPPLTKKPELVVTTGHGDSMTVAELLAKLWQVPLISTHPDLHTPNVTLAILQRSAVPAQMVVRDSNAVFLDTAPSSFTKTEALDLGRELVQSLEAPPSRIWSFHFGGNCAGYSYGIGFDGALEFMERCAKDLEVAWFVSTSRRTGIESENYLRSSLTGRNWFLGGAWFGAGPSLKYPAVVGASEVCVVTTESTSMISDSVNSLRPVLLWSRVPREELDSRIKGVQTVEAFAKNLEARGWCRRLSASEKRDPCSIHFPGVQDNLADHWETKINLRMQELGI